MMKATKNSSRYLLELEKVKEQYQQYIEVSQIYKLPIFLPDPEPQYAPPSNENPLTTNKITLTNHVANWNELLKEVDAQIAHRAVDRFISTLKKGGESKSSGCGSVQFFAFSLMEPGALSVPTPFVVSNMVTFFWQSSCQCEGALSHP